MFSELVKMEKLCHRYAVQYFYLNDLIPSNIKVELDSTLTKRGDDLRNGEENAQAVLDDCRAGTHSRHFKKCGTSNII